MTCRCREIARIPVEVPLLMFAELRGRSHAKNHLILHESKLCHGPSKSGIVLHSQAADGVTFTNLLNIFIILTYDAMSFDDMLC